MDKLDGYSLVYPESWIAVTSSGNDIFLRNPRSVEQNLFVDITSPSSSRYKEVTDLGTPKEAANRLLDQYLTKEFMSTRLGISRFGEVISATSRTAEDGRTYYDIAIRMTSYGSRNAYAATLAEVRKVRSPAGAAQHTVATLYHLPCLHVPGSSCMAGCPCQLTSLRLVCFAPQDYQLEWDRTLSTVLGVANNRLYTLRLQSASKQYEREESTLRAIMDSFRVREVETA